MCNEKKSCELANEIKHLSPLEIEELYKKYLSGEKNSTLIEHYNINIKPNKLIAILPPITLHDKLCPYCETAMFKKRVRKNTSSFHIQPIHCYKCNHKTYEDNYTYINEVCDCNSCINFRAQQRLEEEAEKREKILEYYNLSNKKIVDYIDLSFLDKLFLLTLFRIQTNEEFKNVLSLEESSTIETFSPTHQMDVECLRRLYKYNIIIIDPHSEINAFVINEENNSFFINKVRWIVNISIDKANRSSLDKIYKKIYQELSTGVKLEWKEDVFEILFKIAQEEVLQYIHMRSCELNVNFTAEIKTRETVSQLLHEFSVSEIYYFAIKSVENAHLYYSKGLSNGKKHAANTIPNKILSLGERALKEDWNTYKYNRDSRVPRSCISKVFYDFFLQDEDAGFFKAPGKHWKQELLPKYFSKNNIPKVDLYCDQCKSTDVTAKMSDRSLEVTCTTCGNITSFISDEG